MTTKICPRCKIEKLLTDYHRSSKTKYGVQVYCKTCKTEMQRQATKSLGAYYRKYRATEKYQKWLAEWQKLNRVRLLAQRKAYRDKLRLQALSHYGMKCACCGETTLVFLAIDHINGGGTKQRKEKRLSSHGFYHWLRKNGYPEGFQTLCHNCNWAKHLLGECPHKNNAYSIGLPVKTHSDIICTVEQGC